LTLQHEGIFLNRTIHIIVILCLPFFSPPHIHSLVHYLSSTSQLALAASAPSGEWKRNVKVCGAYTNQRIAWQEYMYFSVHEHTFRGYRLGARDSGGAIPCRFNCSSDGAQLGRCGGRNRSMWPATALVRLWRGGAWSGAARRFRLRRLVADVGLAPTADRKLTRIYGARRHKLQ
jgi:hypothetical protein